MSTPNPKNPHYRHAPNLTELISAYKQAPGFAGWGFDDNDVDEGKLEQHAFHLIYDGEKHWLEFGAGRDMQPGDWRRLVDALCAEFRAGTIRGLRAAFEDVPDDLT